MFPDAGGKPKRRRKRRGGGTRESARMTTGNHTSHASIRRVRRKQYRALFLFPSASGEKGQNRSSGVQERVGGKKKKTFGSRPQRVDLKGKRIANQRMAGRGQCVYGLRARSPQDAQGGGRKEYSNGAGSMPFRPPGEEKASTEECRGCPSSGFATTEEKCSPQIFGRLVKISASWTKC